MTPTSEDLDRWSRRLAQRVSAPGLLAVGALILCGMWMLESWLRARAHAAADARQAVAVALEDIDAELAERQALRDLVARDLVRAKESATTLSRSRRVLFEGGLAVAEEKRLLEKQWEIMTTYLLVDAAGGRVRVMRGEETVESWPLAGAQPKAVGGETRPLPKVAVIVSKERFASPERGKSEQVGGQLQWEPPQVGTSVRASALGENVLFTKEGLVIHGPPLKQAEHEAYPHLCLTVPAATARRLYARSFIGTRVRLEWEKAP